MKRRNSDGEKLCTNQIKALQAVESTYGKWLSSLGRTYRNKLETALATAQERIMDRVFRSTTRPGERIDYVHFSYRSLVLGHRWYDTHYAAARDPEEGSQVSKVITVSNGDKVDRACLSEFAQEVYMYEEAYEILPPIDCEFCAVMLCTDTPSKEESRGLMNVGVYPLSRLAVDYVVNLLIKCQQCPWRIPREALIGHTKEFMRLERNLVSDWERIRKNTRRRRILPSADHVFEFILKSSIITLNLLSDRLFEETVKYRVTKDQRSWEPGMRVSKLTTRSELRTLRKKALQGLPRGDHPSLRRCLYFLPVRLTADQRVVGLLALGSADALSYEIVPSLAVVERAAFLMCREFELTLIQNHLTSALVESEVQRSFAKLMAHELSHPLMRIDNLVTSVGDAISTGQRTLEAFTQGMFTELLAKPVDLRAVLRDIERRHQPFTDGKAAMSLEIDVYRKTLVRVNRQVLEYTLGILVGNALEYGSSPANLRAEVDEGHKQVTVSVKNPGPPLPKPIRKSLTVNGASGSARGRQRRGQGFGRGLKLVTEICRLNRWELTYEESALSEMEVLHRFDLVLPGA
ncbi:MAG: ATP-binding protein [bacterium]